ncbi:MAG: cyanophycinase [Bacillota bacterium]
MGREQRGRLMVIGGAEDKTGDCAVLREFVSLAGGARARLGVIAAATGDAKGAGETYRTAFLRLGAAAVTVLGFQSRAAADAASMEAALMGLSGVFFTGGDQLRITSIIGGTRADEALHRLYTAGAVIAGTSAGASVMSATMIVAGDDDEGPKRCTVSMAPGMGFVEGIVIDQHFAQRGRIGRLLAAVAQNPSVLAVGIDEDTALVVEAGLRFRVIGSQTVTVLDGRTVEHTNASASSPDEPLAISCATLHVLPAGYGFDLVNRDIIQPRDGTNRDGHKPKWAGKG